MRNIAKIVLIVFVSMLEVGYADDCRNELYEKYKARSAEFIKLKNKCKPLLEKGGRLADTYRNMMKNMVEYKEYFAILSQWTIFYSEWEKSIEYKETERVYGECYLPKECRERESDELKALEYERRKKTDKAKIPLDIEINTTCELFLDGVYDIDKAFERIARAEYEFKKRVSGMSVSVPSKKPLNSCVNYDRCTEGYRTAFTKYMAEYDKASESAGKALDKATEPLLTAFINSPEIKEYEAECRGITFPADKDMKSFHSHHDWNWGDYEERAIISYIKSIIANRP